MDARILLKKSSPPVMVTVKGKAKQEDYLLVSTAGISDDDVISSAYMELAEQLRRDERIKKILPQEVITERINHKEIGDGVIEEKSKKELPKWKIIYNLIHESIDGMTQPQLAKKIGVEQVGYHIKVLVDKGLIKKEGEYEGLALYRVTDASIRFSEEEENPSDEFSIPTGTKVTVLR